MKRITFLRVAVFHPMLTVKRIALVALMVFCSQSSLFAAPNEALLRLFNHTFPEAQYIRWTEDGALDVVCFVQDDSQYRIWYDKQCTLVYSLRYCGENELPLTVLRAVKKKYRDRHIEGVTEITNRAGVSYEVLLSDANKWYSVTSTVSGNVALKYSLKKQQE
ncbi:hypothetical protein [Chitinophaga ginsengisoli]|uniref:Uncharacterized protein n=1 Tax=Chitinophaga ginsengisoli TaxID=363837 RepID=A0A2P8GKI9_9BACT|nr:hypothetical protein [Chitinophaga ginsengisoli]PSL34479.1 hypothetical protein CLV42_10250 [Chitinophaga ginsengisoli]